MAKRKPASKTKRPSRTSTGTASRKTKSSTTSTKAKATKKPKNPGDEEVTIDRRRTARRPDGEQAKAPGDAVGKADAPPKQLERRKKVNRRRQIDPTTCERDYTDDEILFMNALDDYKRTSGRMFPTCSEVLEVVRSLGYVKLSPSEFAAHTAADAAVATPESPETPVAEMTTAFDN